MIQRTNIDGKQATVAYLTKDFEPTEPEKAELLKVHFDDGRIMFLKLDPEDHANRS